VITSTRAVISGKTYAIRNITSVSMVKKKFNIFLVIFLGLCALGSLFAIQQSPIAALIGVLIFGGLIYLVVKPRYAMLVASASGEAQALSSPKRDVIEPIVTAMNEAIASYRSS